jgi:hypothetical protein
MRHIKNFNKFKFKPINEELLGGLVNWFKKIWDKAVQELSKMEDDPNKIKDWVINNALNPKDDTNVFSQVLKEFEKKPTANDQDCLNLIDNLLDPETGSLGKQGIGVLLSNKVMQGEELKAKRSMLEYIVNISRNKTIIDSKVKFAGGPIDGKVDPKKKNIDLKDITHLPELKKILIAQKDDERKKRDETYKWVINILIPMTQNYVKSIKEDDIRSYVTKQGIELVSNEFKEGDIVTYQKDKFDKNLWDKLSNDEKKKTNEPPAINLVGVDKIERIEADNIFFKNKEGKEFTKTKDQIIGKAEEEKGANAQNLAKKLGDIKTDEDKMRKVSNYVDFINNPSNKDKIDEIEKITGNNAAK